MKLEYSSKDVQVKCWHPIEVEKECVGTEDQEMDS